MKRLVLAGLFVGALTLSADAEFLNLVTPRGSGGSSGGGGACTPGQIAADFSNNCNIISFLLGMDP